AGGQRRARLCYQFTRVAHGWAVQANPAAKPGCGSCTGVPRPVYFLGDRAQSVIQVGLADAVAPGDSAGTIWLTSYPPGADMTTTAGAAREVSVTGAPAGPQVRLPAGLVIDQATSRGLLLTPAAHQAGTAVSPPWEPALPHVRRP